ncbi:MAG: TGS domain-containing protein, partial [Cyanobacteria bacterium]|nr:TGS domain-containing protein [Cyanobacteriota bacterium]
MTQLSIKLPDGSTKELPAGSTAYDLATQISMGLAKNAVASVINGEVRDLNFLLSDGDE